MAGRSNLSPHDRMSRFIRSKNHIAQTKGIVKTGAFMPALNKKLSVFFTENMKEKNIWQLADLHLPNISIKFRADIKAHVIESVNLNIDYDNTPEYHANIIGWPDGKDKQKEIAIELAAKSTLCKRK